MSRYIPKSKDEEEANVYLVWIYSTDNHEPRRLYDVYKTMKAAMDAEELLVRDEYQYHLIQTRELKS